MLTLVDLIKAIEQESERSRMEVYVVGGVIRDIILHREHSDQDVDFVVVGSGLSFAQALDKSLDALGSLVEFPAFDTARYIIGLVEGVVTVEFAGARSEQYNSASRKPAVVKATLEVDLSRRDFTVNTMAVPLAVFREYLIQPEPRANQVLVKALIDPYQGQVDLKNKLLRTPLEPNVTFNDDPLRMLRAVRFAAQLGFSIDEAALKAMHDQRERFKIVSGERIQEELLKLLATSSPSIGFILLFQTHVLDVILPEIARLDGVEELYGHQHKNNLTHTFKVVDNIALRSNNVWLRMAGLLHDIGKPGTKQFVPSIGWTFHGHEHLGKKMVFALARRLKFSKEHTDYIAHLVRWHLQPIGLMDNGITDSAIRRLIVTMGEAIDDLLILGRSDITTGNPYKSAQRLKNYDYLERRAAEVLEKDKLRAFQSPVKGEEIMLVCALKPGPTVGKIKEAVEEAILDGLIPNEYESAREYFLKIKDEYLALAQSWERT